MKSGKLSKKGFKDFRHSAFTSRELAVAAVLGALSMFFVFTPDVRLPWGMAALDFIAIPWLIAFLLLGLKGGLLTSAIGFLSILFFSEEFSPLVGATMKFSATIPMILIPAIVLRVTKLKYSGETLGTKKFYVCLMGSAIIVRCLVTLFLNYYWAIPFMFGLTPGEVPGSFNFFFWGNPMNPNPLMYYILGVTLWNTWQGVMDAVISWFIVYPTKLHKQYRFW